MTRGATCWAFPPAAPLTPFSSPATTPKGKFYVLTIPNDPADLYALPTTALSVIRNALGADEPVRLDNAPAQVALFRYDNNTFIVQNYLPTAEDVTVSLSGEASEIRDLLTGETIAPVPESERFGGPRRFGNRAPETTRSTSFKFTVLPHSYLAFAANLKTDTNP